MRVTVRAQTELTLDEAVAIAAHARAGTLETNDPQVRRINSLCSLSDDELSPAALATRVVLVDCARSLVQAGRWAGASLSLHES